MNIVEYWDILIRNRKFRRFVNSIIKDIFSDMPKAEPIEFSGGKKNGR